MSFLGHGAEDHDQWRSEARGEASAVGRCLSISNQLELKKVWARSGHGRGKYKYYASEAVNSKQHIAIIVYVELLCQGR